jgi:hypothetical protein
MVLFIAQSALVRVRKVSVHRALGSFGLALAATMILSGSIVSVVMVRFDMTVLHLKTVASFLSVLWCDMIIFGTWHGPGHLFSEATGIPSPYWFS